MFTTSKAILPLRLVTVYKREWNEPNEKKMDNKKQHSGRQKIAIYVALKFGARNTRNRKRVSPVRNASKETIGIEFTVASNLFNRKPMRLSCQSSSTLNFIPSR